MNNQQLTQELREKSRFAKNQYDELLERAADTIEVLDQAVDFWKEKYQRERRRVYEQTN